jgi:Skp family chaperone for outer membrane proteins
MKHELLFSLLATAAAFSSPPAFVRTHTVALKVTAAEQHLETLLEEWNQLESELEAYKDRKDDDVRKIHFWSS